MKTRMLLKVIVLTSLIQGLLINLAMAEESKFSPATRGNYFLVIPERGQSQTDVAMSFGEARRVTSTAGKTHIRTWHYEEFSVYFEQNQVVHAIRRHRRL